MRLSILRKLRKYFEYPLKIQLFLISDASDLTINMINKNDIEIIEGDPYPMIDKGILHKGSLTIVTMNNKNRLITVALVSYCIRKYCITIGIKTFYFFI